jgi:hypothetical protein
MDSTVDSITRPTRLRALSGFYRVEVRVLSGASKDSSFWLHPYRCRDADFGPSEWAAVSGLLSVPGRIAASDSRREASLAHDISLVRRPPNSVEDRDRVEVVAPASDLAIRDREHRDVPVGVGSSGRNDPTL